VVFVQNLLQKEFGWVEDVKAKRLPYIPVVVSQKEVDRIIALLELPYDLVANLCTVAVYACTSA